MVHSITASTLSVSEPSYAKHGRLFHQFDMDGDGKISPCELCACMRTINHDLPLEDAETLVESVDSDGDGLLEFDDFMRLMEVAEGADEEERDRGLREAFGVYEMEGSGCITPTSLRRTLSMLGRSMDIEECEAIICRFDLDGDGVLSFEEFRVMML